MALTPRFLTAQEVADMYRVHVRTVCRLAASGKIPARLVGGHWRFMLQEIEDALSNAKTTEGETDADV